MHNLTKIKIFRIACWITYPLALVFIYPLVLFTKKNSTGLFFFFDRYAIGGAQRIHLDILASVEDVQKQVYFTRKSINTSLKQSFYSIASTKSKDIHFWCDNLLFRLFSVHYYAFYLNRHDKGHVLSANSTFFYDMLPFIKKAIIRTELLHNFTHGKKGMEFFGLANYKYLSFRVVYDTYTLENIEQQYAQYHVPSPYLNRIIFIEPGVQVPARITKDYAYPLAILYAGRGGAQKRIRLLNKIAEHCIQHNWNVRFHFAGTMINELSDMVKAHSNLHGEISSKAEMDALYEQCHAILMTSAYEGFPMLIKESMAYGCIPVVTALKGNLMHLSEKNSLLIKALTDESQVVAQGIENINRLLHQPELLKELSVNAYKYAKEHFRRDLFLQECRAFLLRYPASVA